MRTTASSSASPELPPDSMADQHELGHGVRRLRLDLSYEGTHFSGWAVQPGRRTVAGVLQDALGTVLRAPTRLVVAGRTDAGVHATGQVAHVDAPADRLAALAPRHLAGSPSDPAVDPGCVGLRRRLAGVLPADVRVRSVAPAAPGFDARFSAVSRSYRYRISTTEWGAAPADRRLVLAWRRPLDVAAMQDAAAGLLGLHDFAAYCRPRPGATTIRHLLRLDVGERGAGHRADQGTDEVTGHCAEVHVDVTADAFCHSMVRALVGALLAVGDGRHPVSAPAALLAAGERTAAIAVAPAHGLTLVHVEYPADADLAARAAQTRAVRPGEPSPGR